MRGFLRSNTFKIFLIIFIIVGTITVLSQTAGEFSLANFFGVVTTPMQESVADLTDDQKDKISNMSREELEKYCSELLGENDNLRSMLLSYYDLKQQNELFHEALAYKEQKPDLGFVPALVIGRDISDVYGSFTINSGTNNGIKVGNSVITSSGLVGIISEVSSNAAKVETILNEKVSVGASSKEFREKGIVSGKTTLAVDGFIALEYLNKDTKISTGTLISTSGTSGSFPSDIIIGKVESVSNSVDGLTKYAIVKPTVDVKTVTEVFVVTSFSKVTLPSEEGGR